MQGVEEIARFLEHMVSYLENIPELQAEIRGWGVDWPLWQPRSVGVSGLGKPDPGIHASFEK